MIDRRPAAVVWCECGWDVAAWFAASTSSTWPCRGRSTACPAATTVWSSTVRVDPESWTARAEGGATWADFNARDPRLRPGHPPAGSSPPPASVELTLGGGIRPPWPAATGCQCDNLVFGRRGDRHAVLGWPARKRTTTCSGRGGCNFGRRPPSSFRVHPVKEISRRADVLRAARRREGLCGLPGLHRRRPPETWRVPGLPDRSAAAMPRTATAAGDGGVLGRATGHGGARSGSRHLAPVVAEHLGPMPYPALNSALLTRRPPGWHQPGRPTSSP